MANASSTPDGVGSPEMSDAAAGAWDLSPSEAGEVLSQRSADFAAQVPTTAQDAHDARLILAAKTSDPNWARAFMSGSRAEREEFEALTQTIANEVDASGVVQAPIETTFGDQGIRRQDLIGAISHLGKVGIPPEGIAHIIAGDFPAEDIEWGQRELDRAMATPEWTDALLRGDPVATHEWTAWCALIAAGKAA
jgi:hypothetical protein